MPAQDKSYLARLVAANAGLSDAEAEKWVSDNLCRRPAGCRAPRTVAHSLYWMFVAFLIGAFCASYSATIGGRRSRSRLSSFQFYWIVSGGPYMHFILLLLLGVPIPIIILIRLFSHLPGGHFSC